MDPQLQHLAVVRLQRSAVVSLRRAAVVRLLRHKDHPGPVADNGTLVRRAALGRLCDHRRVLSHVEVAATLRAAGCVFAEDEAAMLLDAAGSPDELDAMVAQRVAGLPLEQVVGWAEFCGLRLVVEPGVFVPRRRTEALAREAVALARGGPRPVVVDLAAVWVR